MAELHADDEVTLRLTITGLYPALRGFYGNEDTPLPKDTDMAKIDTEAYEHHEISLMDMIGWLDDTSDIKVTIEVER